MPTIINTSGTNLELDKLYEYKGVQYFFSQMENDDLEYLELHLFAPSLPSNANDYDYSLAEFKHAGVCETIVTEKELIRAKVSNSFYYDILNSKEIRLDKVKGCLRYTLAYSLCPFDIEKLDKIAKKVIDTKF